MGIESYMNTAGDKISYRTAEIRGLESTISTFATTSSTSPYIKIPYISPYDEEKPIRESIGFDKDFMEKEKDKEKRLTTYRAGRHIKIFERKYYGSVDMYQDDINEFLDKLIKNELDYDIESSSIDYIMISHEVMVEHEVRRD